MPKAVVFIKNNAIVKDVEDPNQLDWPYILEPNLFHLKDVPTYFWKTDGYGKVVEMTRPEKLERLTDIMENGLYEAAVVAQAQGVNIDFDKFNHQLNSLTIGLKAVQDKCDAVYKQSDLMYESSATAHRRIDELSSQVVVKSNSIENTVNTLKLLGMGLFCLVVALGVYVFK